MQDFVFDRFVLDLDERALLVGDERVRLTPRAFDTLLALVERAGSVVTKEALLRRVWPRTHVSDATLTQNIYTIRRALARHAPELDCIETLPRRGYRFREPVEARPRERPGRGGPRDPAAPTTRSVEAHQAYVKGRFLWNERSADGLRLAIEQFERALVHDPDYVLALAGLADSHSLLPLYGSESPNEAFPLAREAAERALAIDDAVAEAHTSLAYVQLFYDWDFPGAGRGFARAIELDPGYPTAHHWLSFLHAALGRHDDAATGAMRALELDPLSLAINADLGLLLYFARRYGESVTQLRVALELKPDFGYARFGLALALVQLDRIDDAIRESEQAVELSGGSGATLAALGSALAAGGRTDEARATLEALRRLPGSHKQASRMALVQAALGETEAALGNLERACEERSRFVVFLDVWPAFDALRGQPRFEQLVRSVLGGAEAGEGGDAQSTPPGR